MSGPARDRMTTAQMEEACREILARALSSDGGPGAEVRQVIDEGLAARGCPRVPPSHGNGEPARDSDRARCVPRPCRDAEWPAFRAWLGKAGDWSINDAGGLDLTTISGRIAVRPGEWLFRSEAGELVLVAG